MLIAGCWLNFMYNFFLSYIFSEPKIITLHTGTQLLLHYDYTYKRAGTVSYGIRWRCSTHSSRKGCNAYVYTDFNIVLISTHNFHNHIPYQYVRLKNGKYARTFNHLNSMWFFLLIFKKPLESGILPAVFDKDQYYFFI